MSPEVGRRRLTQLCGNEKLREDSCAKTLNLKRPRLVWTPQLHKRFLDVVGHLGISKAVPKTIMQLMNSLNESSESGHGNSHHNSNGHMAMPIPFPYPHQHQMVPMPMFGHNGHIGVPAGKPKWCTFQWFSPSVLYGAAESVAWKQIWMGETGKAIPAIEKDIDVQMVS
nr:transcription factor PCL1-like [Ipomoea batatas]